MASPQVLIVGAGVTGSLLATMIKDMGISVRLLEKSRGPGGRMATHSYRAGGRDTPVLARADLGAQYITTRSPPDHAELGPLYNRFLDAGVLAPFTGKVAGPNPYGGAGEDIRHFSAPLGLQAIAKHVLESGGVPVDWGVAVEELSLEDSGATHLKFAGGGAELETSETPRVVILTQPVPQALGESKFPIRGNFLDHVDPAVLDSLKRVEYSSRFAVAFFFDAFQWPFDWTARYFDGGDVRYVSHDSAKRGSPGESALSIVVHSGVPLGIEFIDEAEPFAQAAERILKDLEAKIPEVPWRKSAATKVHKWRYSQVYKGIGGLRPKPDWIWEPAALTDESAPGCVTLFKTARSLGLLCGDAFAPSSNFEGCVFSAFRAAAATRSFIAESQADL